ncbi:hypothetical protein [Haloechinothrix halophila]|uniref:hypothetical protein n=1 Tax=Haloechinothrix halophila TaxID=1069073 RepID=UPI0003FC9B87|nr:hypothetical protein [Haloechinothrix halophila]
MATESRRRGVDRKSYELYFDRFVYPALGDEPIVKITPKVLKDFYAELRRCRAPATASRSSSTARTANTSAA